MLLSALRPSQRAVLEKQLRKNINAVFSEESSQEVLLSEGFVYSHLETLLEDTECQVATDKEQDLRSWWTSEVHRKQAVKQWNETVHAFAESEAARLGVDSYSVKAAYVPRMEAVMDALVLTEDALSGSDIASEEEDSEEESEEDESEEEDEQEEDEEDLQEEAEQLGIKKRKLDS